MLVLVVAVFSLMIVLGVPISMAMLGTTTLFTSILNPGELIAIPHKMFNGIDSFVLIAIPLFLLVGQLTVYSGLLDSLLELSRYLVGRLPGGLAQVNILLNMLMAGISGSASADAAATGSVLIPSMIREKYDPAFSAAVTAAASTIGPVIPPSIPMVALGALVGVSVGRLFLGGVVPGLIVGGLLLLMASLISRRRRYGRIDIDWSWKAFGRTVVAASGPLLIPVIIIGGIVGGLFTPTEAADITVIIVLVLGSLVYRRLNLRGIWKAIRDTVYFLGPVMLIVSAASVFGTLLITQKAGEILASTVLAVSKDPIVILLMISLIVLFLGCFMEALAIMFLITPIVMPLVQMAGIDPIHFGVVLVQGLMIGLITPPVGISMFIACSIARIGINEFTMEAIPFFMALVLALLISIFAPQVILFLPNLLIPVR